MEIKTSNIGGAGLGLFAQRDLTAGDISVYYWGVAAVCSELKVAGMMEETNGKGLFRADVVVAGGWPRSYVYIDGSPACCCCYINSSKEPNAAVVTDKEAVEAKQYNRILRLKLLKDVKGETLIRSLYVY